MAEICEMSLVFSKAGKDKGKPLIALFERDGSVFVTDGKHHKLSNPKRKNPKHLAATNTVLSENELQTDAAIRKYLNKILLEG